MNDKSHSQGALNIVAGIAVAVAFLMVTAAGLIYWDADTQVDKAIEAAATPSRPADMAEVRAGADASAEKLASVLSGATTGEISISSDYATGSISAIRADVGGDLLPEVPASRPPTEKVAAFLAEHGGLLGIDDPARQLKLLGVEQDQYGYRHVSYQQVHGRVPVLGAVLKGHVSPDGRLTAINGKFVPDVNVPTKAVIGQGDASQSAIAKVAQQQPAALKGVELAASESKLVVYRMNLTRGGVGVNHLAYEVTVVGGNQVREFVYVDARTGKIIDQVSGINGLKNRRVYEGAITPEPTPPAWQEGMVRPAVDPAHEDEVVGAGHAYNLFMNLSGGTHRSWDGNDAQMITVNNDPTILCPNANWNGTSTNYCTGTSADDVIVHEWTHAYTQETSGLIYSYQSGALNESYSDVFGETVDLINNREGVEGTAATGNDGPRSQDDEVCSTYAGEPPTTDESIRWLMGEDAFAFSPLPPVGDAAIRDMWRPRCAGGAFFFGNPGHGSSDLYHCTADDAGGVHVNSSINNRAFALLVDGDTVELKDDGTPFASPVTVTGIGITKAAHIFWRANSEYNGPASNFSDNADSLEMACTDLINVNLRKLVTSAEDGTGFLGANEDTIDPTPELSGEVITASDCAQVRNAIAAVEMRHDVTQQCGFEPPLDPAPAPMCEGGEVTRQFVVDWESGIPSGWTIGSEPLLSTSTLETRPWFLRSGDLPKGRLGRAMYQENRVDLGNCSTDDESGRFYMISPEITVAADGPGFLMFEHYFLTEAGFDGGNLMISINGGVFTPIPPLAYDVVPGTAFVHNPYNGSLNEVIDQNTNPKRGEEAFNGANPISGDNNWGQSQVDLAAAGAAPGDTIRLRWDFGQDGCNGNDGWYVDRVEVFTCGEVEPPPPNQECEVFPANAPSPIISTMTSTTTATVSGETNPVSDVHVRNLEGVHTYMGDLIFTLKSPTGTEVTLFDQESCAGADGISAEFDDDAANVIGCNNWLSGGTYRPFEALAAFSGESANGDWTLSITDRALQDDGVLQSWSLELCRDLPPPPPPGEEDVNKATGGGWLADTNNNKINFGFNAKQKAAGGFEGELQLNDKSADVKIHLKTVTSLGPVQGQCGAITDSPRALEFNGTGKFNQIEGVGFRVCVEDNGQGANGSPDRFHLQCTAGCSYNLASRVSNEDVDGGNIQAHRVNTPPPANPPTPDQPSTLILNPVLMTNGLVGALQAFEVNVYGGDQALLAGQNVTLTRVLSTGATQTLNAVAGPTGTALFNVTLATKPAEYQARSGNVGSNAVHVTPALH